MPGGGSTLGVLRALRTDASKGNLAVAHRVAFWQLSLGVKTAHWQIHIKDTSALIAIKMAMLAHVGAKTGRTSVEVDLTDKIALN